MSCAPRGPELVPRDVLFGDPEKAKARISPDGEKMAYLAPVDGVLDVWVKTIGENDDRVRVRGRYAFRSALSRTSNLIGRRG